MFPKADGECVLQLLRAELLELFIRKGALPIATDNGALFNEGSDMGWEVERAGVCKYFLSCILLPPLPYDHMAGVVQLGPASDLVHLPVVYKVHRLGGKPKHSSKLA